MHAPLANTIVSCALGITRGSEEDSPGFEGVLCKGEVIRQRSTSSLIRVTAPQRVLCNNTETNCGVVGWPKERRGTFRSRIEKEKLCESLADVALAATNITRLYNDALVTLGQYLLLFTSAKSFFDLSTNHASTTFGEPKRAR